MFDWPITTEGQFQGVKLDNRMERDADIMRKKQEAAAAKKAAEEAAARAEKIKSSKYSILWNEFFHCQQWKSLWIKITPSALYHFFFASYRS